MRPGALVGRWPSRELDPQALLHSFFRIHNELVDPTRMVARRVYEAVGGYDPAFPIAQDFEFWLRAARDFRFRHTGGGPLVAVRRHGENPMMSQPASARSTTLSARSRRRLNAIR